MTAVIDQNTSTMCQLVDSCYKSEESFRFAAEAVGDVPLRRLFQIYAQQRIRFAQELREYVPMNDLDAASGAGPAYADHEEPDDSENDCVRHCVNLDGRVLALYREALTDRTLPTRVHFLISAQLALLEPIHDRVSTLVQAPLGPRPPGRTQTISA